MQADHASTLKRKHATRTKRAGLHVRFLSRIVHFLQSVATMRRRVLYDC